jgi:PKD repeat protein
MDTVPPSGTITTLSNKKTFNKSFGDLATYKISLKVSNADPPLQASDPDPITINVISSPPTLSGLTAVPVGSSLTTPVQVIVNAVDAKDIDGQIISYKWWYYTYTDDGVQRGVQISQTPQATLTIGTNGKENVPVKYKFGVEMTDNDNQIVTTIECAPSDQPGPNEICLDTPPSIEVVNGPNKEPIAKFDVDRTSINVGEAVNFTSSSSDPDGTIKTYSWDWNGTGIFNSPPADNIPNPSHIFTKSAKNGIKVRLKVEDNQGSMAISDPVTIYVEGNTQPPIAAFVSAQQGTTKKVDFKDNSTADTANGASLKTWSWDFDVATDSNGDGKKDNDIDSTTQNPTFEYPAYGIKRAKLTIADSEGNTVMVTNFVNVKAPAGEVAKVTQPPVAAFTSVQQGTTMKVDFKNNSTADTANGAAIKSLAWDFDTSVDSNGDGKADNDIDSSAENPSYEYSTYGIKKAKLTVTDDKGKTGTVSNLVNVKSPAAVTPTPATPVPSQPKPAAPTVPTTPALDARLITVPSASVSDGKIHLKGDTGNVILDYSTSVGNITKYVIDKNILFDSNGNGNLADDEDYTATTPGKWETDFQRVWGNITVRLTVFDATGKKDSVDKTVVFDAATPTSGNSGLVSVFGTDVNEYGAILVSIIGFAILGSIISRISKANK